MEAIIGSEDSLEGWVLLRTPQGEVCGKVIEDKPGRRVLRPAYAYAMQVSQVPGPDGQVIGIRPQRSLQPWQFLAGVRELVVDGPSIAFTLSELTRAEQQEFRRMITGMEEVIRNMTAEQSGITIARAMPGGNSKPVGMS